MDSIHFPIKDKYVPNSMEQFMVLIETIIGKLKEGKNVVVHCNGGKGRSGTVLVATLVALGRKVQQAIDVVRKARSGTIQNPLQIAYVKSFKTAWRKSKHKQLKEQEKRVVENRKTITKPTDSTTPISNSSAPPALTRSFESPPVNYTEEDKLDLEEREDEKLNPEESAAWKQHKKQILENQENGLDGQEEEVDVNPPLQPPPPPPLTDSRNRSPIRNTDPGNRKKDQGSTGIMSRLMKGNKGEKLTEQEKKQQRKQKKDSREVRKRQAAIERQTKKLEKNKAKLLAAQAPPLSMSPVQTKNSVLGDNSIRTENMEFEEMEHIEPIEIPVDDVHSSDEDVEYKNPEGKYHGNDEVKLIKRNSELFVGNDAKGHATDHKVYGINGNLKEEEGGEDEEFEGEEEKGGGVDA